MWLMAMCNEAESYWCRCDVRTKDVREGRTRGEGRGRLNVEMSQYLKMENLEAVTPTVNLLFVFLINFNLIFPFLLDKVLWTPLVLVIQECWKRLRGERNSCCDCWNPKVGSSERLTLLPWPNNVTNDLPRNRKNVRGSCLVKLEIAHWTQP